jgi:hypothetical protein
MKLRLKGGVYGAVIAIFKKGIEGGKARNHYIHSTLDQVEWM